MGELEPKCGRLRVMCESFLDRLGFVFKEEKTQTAFPNSGNCFFFHNQDRGVYLPTF